MSDETRRPSYLADDEADLPGRIQAFIRVVSSSDVAVELPADLAKTAERLSPKSVSIRIDSPADATLRDLLEEDVLKAWLQRCRDDLAALENVDIDLLLRWSPTVPQEPITLDAEFMVLLSSLDAGIVFDTYDH